VRRSSILLAVLCAASAPAAANKPSNPAFLGIGMQDLSGGPGGSLHGGQCTVMSIERGSGAEAAALQPGDVLERLDGAPVPNCNTLISLITSRSPGTVIRLDIRRHAQPLQLRAELLTRDEILRRRLVGRLVPATELVRVADGARVDLGDARRTTIVGWFPTSCGGCADVLGAVARWNRERAERRAPISVLAATGNLSTHASAIDNLEQLKLAQRSLDVPLLAADYETYTRFAIKDTDRVHFMVIDGRGAVQYVAPIAPSSDDTRAALDELFAAAEQTARAIR
jgi:hypothetical protein